MGNLQDLAEHRKDILLAEVAAWFHDIGKFTNCHLLKSSRGWSPSPSDPCNRKYEYKQVVGQIPYTTSICATPLHPNCINLQDRLGRKLKDLLNGSPFSFFTYLQNISSTIANQWQTAIINSCISISSEKWSVAQIILLGLPSAATPSQILYCFGREGWLPAALGIAHAVAHHDKEEVPNRNKQDHNKICIATAFGWEKRIANLDALVGNIPVDLPWTTWRQNTRDFVRNNFSQGLGDTRRPINEVTLEDWSWTVAALFKSAVANKILVPDLTITCRCSHEMKWRLLSLRTDGLGYMLSAPSIPDLLARKNLLTDAWDRVQKVLEEEYPLGLEVYRDENGPVYVVPDLENLLGLENPNDNYKTLREYLLEAFQAGTVKNDHCLALGGEIVPVFKLDKAPWKGQPAPEELPPIHEHLTREHSNQSLPLQSDIGMVARPWCYHTEEICTVCGLRPLGPSPKAKQRKVCDVCEQRRSNRAKRWATWGLGTTIWLSEVADANRRLALIVGQFDLTHWLNGALVRSLAVRTPNDKNGHTEDQVAKKPSFARLRRIWETTREFWQEVAPTENQENPEQSVAGQAVGKRDTPRLQIKGELSPAKKPGTYHAYELELPRGVRLSVVWDPENERFITADNLHYLEGKNQLGQPLKNVLRKGNVFQVLEPIGYGASDKVWGTITLSEDAGKIENSTYTPLIPILAEPRTFMALVPADKAVDVVQAIRTKYEREMGKVRNRLPLHLGIVFADAHTPLRAILDAGRRMLKQKTIGKVGKWEVEDVTKQSGALPGKAANLAQGTRQFDKWYAVKLKHEDTGRTLTWYVPAVMGDGSTEDNWYPYVFWEQDKDGNTDPGSATIQRKRYYQAPNPFKLDAHGKPQLGWLVHAGELEPGDKVYFTPATLDFQWLDSSASRFEIAYDGENGQRKGNFSRRPYLLDELDTLEHIWNTLSEHLTTSQIHALVSLIESRREDWEVSPHDDTFRVFCRNALANAKWQARPWEREGKAREDWLEEWVNYAALGWLTDAVEIWMKIMKEKPVADKTQGGNA